MSAPGGRRGRWSHKCTWPLLLLLQAKTDKWGWEPAGKDGWEDQELHLLNPPSPSVPQNTSQSLVLPLSPPILLLPPLQDNTHPPRAPHSQIQGLLALPSCTVHHGILPPCLPAPPSGPGEGTHIDSEVLGGAGDGPLGREGFWDVLQCHGRGADDAGEADDGKTQGPTKRPAVPRVDIWL